MKREDKFVPVKRLEIRSGNKDDVSFIFRRILKDLRYSDMCRKVSHTLYYTYMHRAFEHFLTKSFVRVAYEGAYEEDGVVHSARPRQIVGFLVADVTHIGLVVHHCYVRRDYNYKNEVERCYRGQGIATAMIRALADHYGLEKMTYTVRTPMFRQQNNFAYKIDTHKDIQYNPFLFYTLLPSGWETGVLANMNEDMKREINRVGAHVQ